MSGHKGLRADHGGCGLELPLFGGAADAVVDSWCSLELSGHYSREWSECIRVSGVKL